MRKLFLVTGLSIFTGISSANLAFGQGTAETASLYGGGAGIGGGLGAALNNMYGKNKGASRQVFQVPNFSPEQLAEADAIAKRIFSRAQEKEKAGKGSEASKLFSDFAAYREQVFGRQDAKVQEGYTKAGQLLVKSGQHASAENMFRNALASCARRNGPGADGAIPLLNSLGQVSFAQKHFKEASDFYKQSLALQARSQGANSKALNDTRENLAKSMALYSESQQKDGKTGTGSIVESKSPEPATSAPSASNPAAAPVTPATTKP